MVELVKVFLEDPGLLGRDSFDPLFGNLVWELHKMNPGLHLDPDGVLELLEHCNKHECVRLVG